MGRAAERVQTAHGEPSEDAVREGEWCPAQLPTSWKFRGLWLPRTRCFAALGAESRRGAVSGEAPEPGAFAELSDVACLSGNVWKSVAKY